MNLNTIMIGTSDVKKLEKFYNQVFAKEPDWRDDENNFVGYQVGNCYFAIGNHSKVKGKNSNPERLMVNFETQNITNDFERIAKINGAQIVQKPYHPGESKAMLATLADPDGNYFQLNTPFEM